MTAQEQIDEIMDNFDFQKVLTTMKALDWKWADITGGFYSPNESDLRRTARSLLKRIEDKEGWDNRRVFCL